MTAQCSASAEQGEQVCVVIEVDAAKMLEDVLDEMDPELAAGIITEMARTDAGFGLLLETNLTAVLDEVCQGERPDVVT